MWSNYWVKISISISMLQYSAISDGLVTNRHTLLAPALSTAGQIKLDGNSIPFALLNRFKLIIPSSSRQCMWTCFLPVDVCLTECNKTVILFIHIKILNESFTKKVVKTPEQTQQTAAGECQDSASHWHSGALALSPERQSAWISQIKNGGLDQYGKMESRNGIGGEKVESHILKLCMRDLETAPHFANCTDWHQHNTLKLLISINET